MAYALFTAVIIAICLLPGQIRRDVLNVGLFSVLFAIFLYVMTLIGLPQDFYP